MKPAAILPHFRNTVFRCSSSVVRTALLISTRSGPALWEDPPHDGVVACEGSMFKSKFANALTTMMIGSLAIASAQNKLSVAYGAEAGHMDPLLARMCERYCHDSLVITRNEESRTVLRELGVLTELGT